jgi:hypothetical protein
MGVSRPGGQPRKGSSFVSHHAGSFLVSGKCAVLSILALTIVALLSDLLGYRVNCCHWQDIKYAVTGRIASGNVLASPYFSYWRSSNRISHLL